MRDKTGIPPIANVINLNRNQLHFYAVNLDYIKDGVTYGRVLTTDISAGHILLSETVGDLDDISDGVTNGKVLLTDLSSGHIKLSSVTVVDGDWYDESGVDIDATAGITIYGTEAAFRTRATKTGTNQCYVGANGKMYAGAGSVILDADGLTIDGPNKPIYFKDGATSYALFGIADDETGVTLVTATGKDLNLISGDDLNIEALESGKRVYLEGDAGVYVKCDLRPNSDDAYYLGYTGATFARGYINRVYAPTRLVIPVGADMYS